MKKFIALAAVVLVSMATTTMYAQESRAEKRADRKAQRDAERARLKAEEQAQAYKFYRSRNSARQPQPNRQNNIHFLPNDKICHYYPPQ